jgi:4-alpha-glucanotransferase
VLPTLPQQASPYFPSSRRFRNPLYIRVEDVPGFGALATDLAPVAAAGRALNHAALIDRDAIHQLKMGALERLWNAWPAAPAADRAALSAFVAAAGPPLSAFATFNALAEREAGTWRSWPEALRRPATASLSGEAAARAGFHAWLQWLLDRQLAAAGRELPLVQDLAVGVDPAGADAWEWQDVLIPGFHVGAPPDEFNLRGQSWGFPAFDPGRLAALGGAPLAAVFAAAMRHSGGLRVDHVMALFRLWLIPDGGGPADGVYLTYPAALLLDVLAEASRAARAWVVGEDLGTVEPGVRRALAARGVLSSRLLWFEAAPPEAYPAQAMAALTTHDLPTVAGLWTGDDLRAQRAAGMVANESGAAALRDRLAGLTGLAPDADPAEAVARAYAVLAQAPSMLLAAGLEDATVERRRPNLPGTTDQWPNWRIPLAVPVEELDAAPAAAAIARALRRE